MFSLTGQPNHAWDGKLPGYPAFEVIQDAVAAACPRPSQDSHRQAHSLLWAALHGLVVLRNDRPAFPWATRQAPKRSAHRPVPSNTEAPNQQTTTNG